MSARAGFTLQDITVSGGGFLIDGVAVNPAV